MKLLDINISDMARAITILISLCDLMTLLSISKTVLVGEDKNLGTANKNEHVDAIFQHSTIHYNSLKIELKQQFK